MLAGKMTAAARADLRARKAEKPVDPRAAARAMEREHAKQLAALDKSLNEARDALRKAIDYTQRIKPHCTHIDAVRSAALIRQVCANGLEDSQLEMVE